MLYNVIYIYTYNYIKLISLARPRMVFRASDGIIPLIPLMMCLFEGAHRRSKGWDNGLMFIFIYIIEGSLEVKLPTIWTDEKQRWEESEKRREEERERVRRKKIQVREKIGKSRNTVFFQWFVAPEGRKVGSLTRRVRSQLARWEMNNCTPLWREAHFEVNMYKTLHARATFGRWSVALRGRRKGLCTLSKMSKMWGFCRISKNDGRRGTFEEDLPRWIFRDRRSTKDMFIRDARRSRRWFPEWLHFGASDLQFWEDDFAWQVQHFVWPGLTFPWQAQYFLQVKWKNRKMQLYEAVSFALNFPFLKEVSQNCFVFDVVNFEKWGSLAELFRFWCCQVQKLRTSRRIAAFLMLSSSKTEELSQNSFVFKLADRQIDRQTGR